VGLTVISISISLEEGSDVRGSEGPGGLRCVFRRLRFLPDVRASETGRSDGVSADRADLLPTQLLPPCLASADVWMWPPTMRSHVPLGT
jgi:hypothetical protein